MKSSGSPVALARITQRYGTSEVFWKSCATHLTQWALPEQLVHGSPGDCWARRGLLHKWLLGPKRSAAQEVVFESTGLRDLKGVPRFTVLQVTVGPKRPAAQGVLSLAVSRRGQPERRSMRGERCSERNSLGTLSCYPGEARRDGQGEGMITPLGNGVRQLLVIMPSTAPFRKRKHSVDTESAQHARTLCHTPLHRHCAQ